MAVVLSFEWEAESGKYCFREKQIFFLFSQFFQLAAQYIQIVPANNPTTGMSGMHD